MAKYHVTYACGHEDTVQLYGKGKDRERRLEWMANQDCPKCWGEKKRAEDDKQPITMTICTNGMDTDKDGDILAEIVLTGGTRPRKDEIKALGYYWGEVRGGVMNFLSVNAPQKAWSRTVKLIDLEKCALQIKTEAGQLGAKIKNGISSLDLEMARQRIAERAEKQEAAQKTQERIAEIPKPERPACHPREQHPDGHWNGKYYGKSGYRNYYVSNVKYELTDEEYANCMVYRKQYEEYKTQCDAINQ